MPYQDENLILAEQAEQLAEYIIDIIASYSEILQERDLIIKIIDSDMISLKVDRDEKYKIVKESQQIISKANEIIKEIQEPDSKEKLVFLEKENDRRELEESEYQELIILSNYKNAIEILETMTKDNFMYDYRRPQESKIVFITLPFEDKTILDKDIDIERTDIKELQRAFDNFCKTESELLANVDEEGCLKKIRFKDKGNGLHKDGNNGKVYTVFKDTKEAFRVLFNVDQYTIVAIIANIKTHGNNRNDERKYQIFRERLELCKSKLDNASKKDIEKMASLYENFKMRLYRRISKNNNIALLDNFCESLINQKKKGDH